MEIRINPENVSHIKIYDQEATGYKWCDKIPVKKVFFNSITVDYGWSEGYWQNGVQGSFNGIIKELKDYMRDIDGEIWFMPCITVFCGETKIKTHYFNTLGKAEEYCDLNFKNVSVVL